MLEPAELVHHELAQVFAVEHPQDAWHAVALYSVLPLAGLVGLVQRV